MKNHARRLSFIFITLLVFSLVQQIQAQKESGNIDLNYIVSKLTSQNSQEINNQLIEEISKRKVNFVLSSEDENTLKHSGANDLLIKTIDENASEEVKNEITRKVFSINCDKNCSRIQSPEANMKLAKQLIRVFSNVPEYEMQVSYLKKTIPRLEKEIEKEEQERELNKIYEKFNQAFKNKKWDKLFEAGASILEREPEFVDVSLTLASVGFDDLVKNSNRKYLDETLRYAQKSIELLEKDKVSSEFYGAFDYRYKTEKFPDGRANALGWMNYIIGYTKYFQLNEKDEAIPYFQKSLNYKSESNELVRQLNLLSENK